MNAERAIDWYSEEIEKYKIAKAKAELNGAPQIVEQAEIVIQMLGAGLSALREKAGREGGTA